ncbi:hypothetical protein WJX75_006665 [Coccomyxa subellipsoidea]|uniref:Protein kinase domain-containing protein n=1 Tax=Coccomyxa subellipsoidea TaxID=248742 RepID=A0ABR2Z472_9CHLO
MEGATAFQPFQSLQNLQQTACACPSPFNVPVQLTLGLTSLHQAGKDGTDRPAQAPSLASQTLGDGRLNVGTHMPLLAKRYSYLSVIGEGASAQVILAEDTLRQGGHLVAIKIMKRQYSYAGQKEARALRYIQSRSPECTRVVRLLGTFTHAGHMCLVLERLFPSLLDYLSLSATLSPCTRLANLRSIAYQLLGTVAVLHASGVVNADLKPDNVLLRQPHGTNAGACPEVVISDFGSAFSETETDTSRLVFEMQTLPYRAPEVALGLGSPLVTALDVWSLGCILAELALQQPLFPCHSPAQLLKQIEQQLGPLPPQLQRSSSRPGVQLPASSSALVKPGAAKARSAGQSGLPWLGNDERIANSGAAVAFMPATMPGQMWHEALSPLGQELAKVDRGLADLVMGMLQLDASQRLTAAAALLHPFFDAVSPMRALMQATLQPVLSWNSQAHSKEPQQQAQPNLALSHKLEQTGATSAVEKGSQGVEPGQKLPEEEDAGGNASHSSPSSPGTPGSAGRAAHQPPAAAAGGAAGSQSEDSHPADQPAALSSTGGVRPPARGVTAAALRPAEADQAAVKDTDNPGANGAATSPPEAAAGLAGRDVASAPGSGRAAHKESLRQEHRSAQNTHQHSDILKQQRSARGGARPLVNPAMERAIAASGSAGSLSRPARRQQSDSAAVSLETESLPRQTASATPMQRTTDAEVAAAQVKVSAATNAPATSGHGGVQRTSGKAAGDRVDDAGVTSGTASKRRRAPEGDSGESRAKRGRAADTDATQPEPEPSGQSNLNGAIEEASPAEQPAAVATGNPGMSLDVLAAAASSVIAAFPVHCWPRRRTSIGGTPSKNGSRARPAAAAAAASTPGKPGAAKRPSPLIKWPAAAEAMPDKSATTASPKSPARGETASEQKPLQAAKTPARAAKKQPVSGTQRVCDFERSLTKQGVAMASEELHALPEDQPGLSGESIEKGKGDRYVINVSNAKGYLCHIHMESKYDCPPEMLFAIFTNPDNTGVFRDIKKRGKRKVLELDPAGRKIVEVEQIGEAKVLFKMREFTTLLKVDEDARNPEELRTGFTLIRSDILSRFNGCWSMSPIRNAEGTEVVGTAATLEQDILPAGAPAFLKHVPLLGNALRGICVRAVKRMVEDLDNVLEKVRSGTPLDDILKPAQPVASHVLDDFSDGEDADISDGPPSGHKPDSSEKHGLSSTAAIEAKAAALKSSSAPHSTAGQQSDGDSPEDGPGGFWDRQSWPSPTKQRGGGPPN